VIIRKLDENNDWAFGKSKNDYLTEVNAIKLNVKTRLYEWKTDCFFGLKNGIDWSGRFDEGNKQNLDTDIKTVILGSDGVVAITSYSSRVINRKYTAEYNIQTVYSKTFTDIFEV
jgi:hypothetical protein